MIFNCWCGELEGLCIEVIRLFVIYMFKRIIKLKYFLVEILKYEIIILFIIEYWNINKFYEFNIYNNLVKK